MVQLYFFYGSFCRLSFCSGGQVHAKKFPCFFIERWKTSNCAKSSQKLLRSYFLEDAGSRARVSITYLSGNEVFDTIHAPLYVTLQKQQACFPVSGTSTLYCRFVIFKQASRINASFSHFHCNILRGALFPWSQSQA